MRTVYLDNNATTAVDPKVLEAMLPYFSTYYGNPSSMHHFGGQVGDKIVAARKQVADALGCSPEEIIFTSCGSESDNTALFSAVQAHPEKRHLVTSRVEHPAILKVMDYLAKQGYEISYIDVDSKGRLNMDAFTAALREDTAIVSLMFANNETGTLFPIAQCAALCKEKGILFHTDAVQAVGKEAIDLSVLPIDYLSLSGHKLHAPKGIGVLFVRKGAPFFSFLHGGHQENGRRAGTENVASIIALGKACELAMQDFENEHSELVRLRDRLEAGILATIPDAIVNGDPEHRLANTLNIAFQYVEGEAILLLMDKFGIYASSGSACTSGSLEASHVLRAMQVPFSHIHGSVRFSLSRFTTDEDIDTVLRELPKIIAELRAISPYRKQNA